MSLLLIGIFFWVIGFAMIIWCKRRKHYRTSNHHFQGYFEHLRSKAVDVALWWIGLFSVLWGTVLVGSQEYTDAIWLGFLFISVVVWLSLQLPVKTKSKY